MSKKIFKGFAIFSALCVFLLMAVGSGSSSDEPTKKEIVAESDVSEDKKDAKEETSKSEKANKDAVTIKEKVLVDKDGLKITAKELVEDAIWGTGIKILVENNTKKTLMVACDAAIVNDFMVTDLFASEIAPNKKSNDTIYLTSESLKAAGIENIGRIELYFRANDSKTLDRLFEQEKSVLKTSAFDKMDTKVDDTGKELLNEKGIRIVGKYVSEESFWGTAVLLYIENNTDKNITVTCDEMSINSFMVTPYFYSTVYGKKKAFDEISILETDLEENDIEDIKDIELKFNITDADTYKTILNSKAINFSVKK